MLGIHVEGTAEGWFGPGKSSAILSIVALVALIAGVAFGIFTAVNARGETSVSQPVAPAAPAAPTPTAPTPTAPAPAAPTPVQTPPVAANEPTPAGVIKITTEQLVKDLLTNPNKYKKEAIFQVSGVLVWHWKYENLQSQYTTFFLGPAVYANDYRLGVDARVFWEEKETLKAFNALNDGDQVVVRGIYVFFSASQGVSLENCSLISATPAK